MSRLLATALLFSPLLALTPSLAARAADATASDNGGGTAPVSTVTVIGTTPLPGADIDRSQIPGPVQVATSKEIDRSHAADLTAFMNRSLGSVYVNEIQENPLQPDINFRGYTASPLLGTPQGMSIYMDGVRLNQPFGDVVSWDLIPRAAIETLELMPGSNPLFGLNTLGGALSIRTKDGYTSPGIGAEVAYGSHSERTAELDIGGHADNGLHWFLTANKFKDAGWREFSPTDATQAFGKFGWKGTGTEIALTAAYAKTDLTGNGFQDQRLLARDRASVYTIPDNTRNNSGLIELSASHELAAGMSISGNAFYRNIRTNTFNGDINDDSIGESLYQPNSAEQAALTDAGYTGFPTSGETQANTPFPQWRCIADILLNTEPNEKCNGLDTRALTSQHERGITGQFNWATGPDERRNRFTAGFYLNESGAHFTQGSQFGYLTPIRTIVLIPGPGAFADGTQDSQNAFDARVDLTGRTSTRSVYVSDVLALGSAVQLSLAARYDHTSVRNRDGITPADADGTLTADNTFSRLNPGAGVTFQLAKEISAYVSYAQSSRAPSSVELGCADPENPCRLPNALAGDPPLKQVVAKTFEAGLRGSVGQRFAWSAGAFRAENDNDIQFVSDSVSGVGYFANFGETRRQGIELAANGRVANFTLGANFTLLDATYRSSEVVDGAGNSTNDADAPGFEGDIQVSPGDRIPLVPRQIFKSYVQWDISRQFSLDADMIYIGRSFSRGNENNAHQPDGLYYLGPGYTGGYPVANLGAEYHPTSQLKLFFQVNNLFDKRYASASILGTTGFDPNGNFVSRPFAGPVIDGERPQVHTTFYAPGAPRSYFGGIRYEFAGK